MKPSLERLATHRLHTLELVIKDLSIEELNDLSQILAKGNPRTAKSKLALLKKEILSRQSSVVPPVILGLIGTIN